MTARPIFAWYDLWVGVFIDRAKRRVYIFPLPCLGIVIAWPVDRVTRWTFTAPKDGTYEITWRRPAPWCQWCDDIGHDEADCPEFEREYEAARCTWCGRHGHIHTDAQHCPEWGI